MNVRRFAESQTMMQEAAAALAGALNANTPAPSAVMLSGGQTPMRAYQLLPGLRVSVSPQAYVFFSDERLVPPDSPDSNYGRIRPFLWAVHIPDERILRVNTTLDLAEAADDYDQTFRNFLGQGARIPLGFLGIGADGHTASLFTPADLERGQNRFAIAVPRPVKPDRVSVTPKLLEHIGRIIFLVAGPEKAAIAEQLLRDPMRVIANRAVMRCKNVELWVSPTA